LGKHDVANALRSLDARVEVHADHFAPDTPDAQWLPVVGKKGWVVLTRDRHILTRTLEIIALLKANTHAFVLKSRSELTGAEMAAAFMAAYPHMDRLIASHTPPFLARVTATGHVAEIEGYKQILRRIK